MKCDLFFHGRFKHSSVFSCPLSKELSYSLRAKGEGCFLSPQGLYFVLMMFVFMLLCVLFSSIMSEPRASPGCRREPSGCHKH